MVYIITIRNNMADITSAKDLINTIGIDNAIVCLKYVIDLLDSIEHQMDRDNWFILRRKYHDRFVELQEIKFKGK